MRHKDPELMKKIYDFAENYYFSEGRSPTMQEISDFTGIVRSTAYKYLIEMDKRGMVRYDGKSIITESIRKLSNVNRGIGIYDTSIPCGELEELEPQVSEYVDLPVSIFGDRELYVLRTKGESMIDAGIEPGDLVVIEKTEIADEGNIVVALGDDTNNSLKRLVKRNGKYILHPENKDMEDISVKQLEIQGVARFVIKKL